MSNLHLKTTITKIAKFERETGESLIESFSSAHMGVATIIDLVRAFSEASDDEIDAYVKEHGFEALNGKLLESLEKSGFLAQTPETEPAKAQ